jgi:hypothetical protein
MICKMMVVGLFSGIRTEIGARHTLSHGCFLGTRCKSNFSKQLQVPWYGTDQPQEILCSPKQVYQSTGNKS